MGDRGLISVGRRPVAVPMGRRRCGLRRRPWAGDGRGRIRPRASGLCGDLLLRLGFLSWLRLGRSTVAAARGFRP